MSKLKHKVLILLTNTCSSFFMSGAIGHLPHFSVHLTSSLETSPVMPEMDTISVCFGETLGYHSKKTG